MDASRSRPSCIAGGFRTAFDPMTGQTTSAELRRAWREGREIALIDVRDEGRYSERHPFFAVSLPLAELEQSVLALVPRQSVPVVVYDDGEGLAEKAAHRLTAAGYSDVSVLAGGLTAYGREGELFRDVNVPSKAFGELVEAIRHTPSLPADEILALIDGNTDMVVLDARRFEEYRNMSIPTGISVPGAELVLRVHDLAPSPETLVVVNCAGRTRSIIGTQSLINAGLPNRIVALRNGTIGWTLAGQRLDHGQDRRAGTASETARHKAAEAAARWARHVGVEVIDRATLDRFVDDLKHRTLYRLDVRTPEEYAAGHPDGFRSAPGGQLVQATDEWIGVRGARIVLYDDDGVRARMTASWLRQMGWDASVIDRDQLDTHTTGVPQRRRVPPPDPAGAIIGLAELASGEDFTLVDLARSAVYARGHIAGAHFIRASRFATDLAGLPGNGPIVLISTDGDVARFARPDAQAATSRRVLALAGGTEAWLASGRTLSDNDASWVSPPTDVYKRPYEGTDNAGAAMQAYIDWELQLVAQLANDGVSNFRVARPPVAGHR